MDRPRLGEQRVDFTPPDRVGDRRLGILPLLLSDPPIGGGLILTASCPMGLEQTDGSGRGGLIDQSGIMLREGGAHLARLPYRRLKHFPAGGLEAAEQLPHLFAIPVRRTGLGGGRGKTGVRSDEQRGG